VLLYSEALVFWWVKCWQKNGFIIVK